MNVTKWSQKNFFLSNIWKNATFIENNFFLRWPVCGLSFLTESDFSCLFTFLVRKKNFLRKTTPTHFKFSWMCQGHFCHFWKFLLVNLKPVSYFEKNRYNEHRQNVPKIFLSFQYMKKRNFYRKQLFSWDGPFVDFLY